MNWIFDAYSNVYNTAMTGRSVNPRSAVSVKLAAPVEVALKTGTSRSART